MSFISKLCSLIALDQGCHFNLETVLKVIGQRFNLRFIRNGWTMEVPPLTLPAMSC